MIKVIVIGAIGRMGRTVCDAVLAEDDLELAGVVDVAYTADENLAERDGLPDIARYGSLEECLKEAQGEVAVDFTVPEEVFSNVMKCLKNGVRCVVGTTGLKDSQLDEIKDAAGQGEIGCLVAPNFAIGAVLMMEIAKIASRYLPSCEIIESHHDQKLDAPSGTALRTAELISTARKETPVVPGPENNSARGVNYKDIPIHSVRLPGLVAHQEIIFGGQGQTLTIRHDSISRDSFMPGVILAVRRVMELDNLVIGLEKIM
jgi:4-hydroxy-tetrahydrodipicolinate reductase